MIKKNVASYGGPSESVYLGGPAGGNDLATASNTAALLATGRAGLYLQGTLDTITSGLLPQIASIFASTGQQEAEQDLQPAAYAASYFGQMWTSLYTDNGFSPGGFNFNINYAMAGWLNLFEANATAVENLSATYAAPIFSPNGTQYSLTNFATNPAYASLRTAAQFGGGITLDTPPSYFLSQGYAYQQFAYQEIRWAHQNGLVVSVIVSPYSDDANFQSDVQTLVQLMEWNDAIPTHWIVENYTPTDTNGVGSDLNPNSMAGAALWIAQNGLTGSSANVPIPTPTMTVSAPGSIEEVSYNAGVVATETVTTRYVSRLYYGVVDQYGNVESSYFIGINVNANASGYATTTFTVPMLHTGDQVIVENDLSNPSVFVKSAAVQITEPAGSITITGPTTAQEPTPGAGVNVTETINTVNVDGSVWYGVLNQNGDVESSYFQSATLDSNGSATINVHLDYSGDYVLVLNSLNNSSLRAQGPSVHITEAPAYLPMISISDPGTVQEASPGAGVTVTETMTTTNMTSHVDVRAVTANGTPDGAWLYPTLSANGVATANVFFAHTGDELEAEDNITTPSVTVYSSPITITDPVKSITLSSPGTVQEASPGAGVTVSETATVVGFTGHVDLEVVTSTGSVDSGWVYPTLTNGVATAQLYFAHSGDSVLAVDNITTPTVTAQSSPITITDPTASEASKVGSASLSSAVNATHQSNLKYPTGLTVQEAYADVLHHKSVSGMTVLSANTDATVSTTTGSTLALTQSVKSVLYATYELHHH